MPRTINRAQTAERSATVRPSIVDPQMAEPFTLDQELEPFGRWVSKPIWVPPKDASETLAESMLRETRPFTSKEKRWEAIVDKHRDEFTQVREFDMQRASIRLPKERIFMLVTEQRDFDKIEDEVPGCVQTRLDEFLAGPGQQRGVKVYYLKPLCVESGDYLIFTTGDDLQKAITRIQDKVFAEYARRAPAYRVSEAIVKSFNTVVGLPGRVVKYFADRRQRSIDAYEAKLEFKRRQTALHAAQTHCKLRTDGCTYDEMLSLTNDLRRTDVVARYCEDEKLSRAQRDQLLHIAGGGLPWFVGAAIGGGYMASIASYLAFVPPVVVCDPAFVAEMPDNPGVLLKIGHFDEVRGVTHVEI